MRMRKFCSRRISRFCFAKFMVYIQYFFSHNFLPTSSYPVLSVCTGVAGLTAKSAAAEAVASSGKQV